MATGVPPEFRGPIARHGPSIDAIARQKYGISGQTLLAKLLKGESSFNMGAVSPAGARGAAQFMPGTRRAVLERFGVDPWRSPEEAVHAAAIHLRGELGHAKGLEGYNPGGGRGYVRQMLGQDVSGVPAGDPGAAAPAGAGGGLISPEQRQDIKRAVVWVTLATAGLVFAGLGLSRSVGVRNPAGAT